MKLFQKELIKRKIGLAILYNVNDKPNTNMLYFTNYAGIGALIIPKDKKPFLVVPSMEFERAKKSGIKVVKWKKSIRLFKFLSSKIKRVSKIGIDMDSFILNHYRELKRNFKNASFVDISKLLYDIRKVKTKNEIIKIRKSCYIASKVMKNVIMNIRNFKTENEVSLFIEDEAKKNKCELAFKPIVASGNASSMPHYIPKKIKLRKGFCIIDFGVKYKGYCSDITRTIYLGNPSKKEIEIYNFLLDKHIKTINSIKINIRAGKVFEKLNKSLGKYKKKFIHGLGHGIGLEVHELPNFTEKSKDRLINGMTFTIEPGLYFYGKYGVRIEDCLLLDKKVEILTNVKREMIVK